jgi:hypothetical protein
MVNCSLAAKPHTFSRGEGGPAQAGTEEEWRNLKYGKKPKQVRKSNISARIPLQPQCAHWGSFPSGEAIAPAALGTINYNLSSCYLAKKRKNFLTEWVKSSIILRTMENYKL